MAPQEIENRLKALENEIAEMRLQLPKDQATGWKKFVGAFQGDATFAKAMKAGRRYRKSLRRDNDERPAK